MKPNLISNGEVLAGKYLSHSGYQFGDGTYYGTALVHYISAFDTTTQVGSTTTGTAFSFDTVDVSNGISITSDGTRLTRFTFSHGGVYNFIWSGQFENSVNSDKDIYVWFRKNNQDIIGSTGLAAISGSHGATNGHNIIGWNFFITVNAGDFVQLMWVKEDAGTTLAQYPATATYPSTASVVMTINQIA